VAITYEIVKSVSANLYESSLKKIPEDTKAALRRAHEAESNDGARKTPVAVCFNCWINRRASARIYNDSNIVYFE
jgi:fumarate hydratase subunit alpha